MITFLIIGIIAAVIAVTQAALIAAKAIARYNRKRIWNFLAAEAERVGMTYEFKEIEVR